MNFTVSQLAEQLRAEVIGDGAVELTGFEQAENAKAGDLTFADNVAYLATAEASQASAILTDVSVTFSHKTLLRVPNVRLAVACILPVFYPPERAAPGIHPTASIDASAHVDPSAHIGPYCVVGARARIGARTSLLGANHVGADCRIGEDSCLFPHVTLYARSQIGHRVSIHAGTVIGSDGYAYVLDQGQHRKVLQLGHVVIQDDVEIGANTAIDRGAFGATTIGQGTKIDNLVHIAHNVALGSHCLVLGQVGFAGSTSLGNYSVVASQSGISGHLKIGSQVIIGAKSGVMRDIPDGAKMLGIPATPDKQAKRQMIAVQQLPDVIRRLRDLEKQVAHREVAATI